VLCAPAFAQDKTGINVNPAALQFGLDTVHPGI
jgi:hypothetical protein